MKFCLKYFLISVLVMFLLHIEIYAQDSFIYSGKVVDALTGKPVQNATVHLAGYAGSTITREDGSFYIRTNTWYDTLQITSIGYELFKKVLEKQQIKNLQLQLIVKSDNLQTVSVNVARKPGKSFMERVISHKMQNDPQRFNNYSYERYGRNELDLDNLDYNKKTKKNMQGLMSSVYVGLDSNSKFDKELPIYFSEILASHYHSVSPSIEKENILAKKSLGLKTDELLRHLDKFYLSFNIYDDWIPVFDLTFASPLSNSAFSYYNFYYGDTLVENGNTIRQIRFTPIHPYERAFTGTLWIDDSSYAVTSVNMHLTKTVNLNYINNIYYGEDYKQIYDSSSAIWTYMPAKWTSEVKFEAGPALLGIPVPDNKNSLKLVAKNTTFVDRVTLNTNESSLSKTEQASKESQTHAYVQPDSFWVQNRLDSLSSHEKIIYRMIDSLRGNKQFERNVKLIAFAGSGFWDFGNRLRIGPYFTLFSHNPLEGWRFRMGFWSMPGISKKLNLYGYAAYGVNDKALNGGIGLKYIWNENKWTKTSIWFGKDYDFIIEQNGELDKANIFNSFLRKNIPFSRIYIRQILLKHEQYISENFTARAGVSYKELNPVFSFSYSPFNAVTEKSIDTVSLKLLPVAEFSVGLQYAPAKRTVNFNYDQLRLESFSPVVNISFTHGFELARTHFDYDKINVGIAQQVRLPPKSIFYYSLNLGQVFGTIPYILLNVPAGNEYLVSSRYLFNTMSPYEFASDRYVDLHTRISLGGMIFDHIPLIKKLGWRERLSYNMYYGDMTSANQLYNKNAHFNLIGNQPFIEAGAGVENIFHILFIEYYKRFTHLNDPYAMNNGVFLGVHLSF